VATSAFERIVHNTDALICFLETCGVAYVFTAGAFGSKLFPGSQVVQRPINADPDWGGRPEPGRPQHDQVVFTVKKSSDSKH
jgi:hypothetical protein